VIIHRLSPQGEWCGCGYFESKRRVEPDDRPVDFNSVAIPNTNKPHAWNWFTGPDDIREWASPRGDIVDLDAGDGSALVAGAVGNSGDCARVVLRGMSYHPAFRGSKMETMFALRCIAHQWPNGVWRGHHLSFIFGMLERCRHPLSTFAVLRSLPLLIRLQQKSGLWDENDDGYNTRRCHETPPSPEQGSFLILKALNTHGLLEALLPRGAKG